MSDMKDMIGESVNRIFSDTVDRKLLEAAESGAWQADLWGAIDESGFADVLVSESEQDFAGKWEDAYPVFHAIGLHQVPLPLSETIIARALASRAGLPIANGPATVLQQQPDNTLRLSLNNNRLILNGAVATVPWARVATSLVVVGYIGDEQMIGVVDANAAGMAISHGINVAREPRDDVTFNDCICKTFCKSGGSLPDDILTLYGALARAAMMAGASERVLRESVQYANDRIQFGRPIGKFQAIQQSLAILAGEVTSAQTAALVACMGAGASPQRFAVAVAKIRAGKAAGIAANIGHQVHGAIGFTYEHSLHFATRRLWSWRAEFGAESTWAHQLGVDAIQRRGSNFWADLTYRGRGSQESRC